MAEKLIRSFDDQPATASSSSSAKSFLAMAIVIALVLGLSTGFVLSKTLSNGSSATKSSTSTTADGKKSAGIADKNTYKDPAEGVLREGGMEGEGSFHLERPGGESQNVYLTSSTVDLSEFIGKKVKVMGQTFDSEKAGWLMDVGYIELQ